MPEDEQADLSKVDFDHDITVRSDKTLSTLEREFSLTVPYDQKRFYVHSDIPSITRALLQHPGFEAEDARINEDGELTSIRGRLDMGYMKIGPTGRTASNTHSQIINPNKATEEEKKQMQEAFSDDA